MFSKNLRQILLAGIIFSTLFQMACSDFLNGAKKKEEVIEVQDTKLGCLNNVSDVFNRYLESQVQDREIIEVSNCAQEALTYFSERTKGSQQDSYTTEDLRKFFGKYFLKDKNFSESLAEELMRLKSAFFGGTERTFSRSELDRLIQFIGYIKIELIALRPHMKTILLKKENSPDWLEIEGTLNTMKISLTRLLKNLDLVKSEYSFEDTRRLAEELTSYIGISDKMRYFSVAESIKSILVGRQATLRGTKDWQQASENFLDLYGLVMKYHYKMKDRSIDTSAGVSSLSIIVNDVISLIENSVQMKKEGRIPLADFDQLIDSVYAEGFQIHAIKPETIKVTYRNVTLYMLDSVRRGDPRGLDSFERQHLMSLRREYDLWSSEQSFIDETLKNNRVLSLSDFNRAHTVFQASGVAKGVLATRKTKQELQDYVSQGAIEFGALLNRPKPLSFTELGRVRLTQNMSEHKFDWMGATVLNLVRTVTRAFQIGYGTLGAVDLFNSYITPRKLSDWYEHYDLLGSDLKAFDPRNKNSSGRSFKEANFFTPNGDGDEKMTYDETYEFLSILLTAGFGNKSAFEKLLRENHCDMKERDVFDLPWMNEPCFAKTLRKDFGNIFSNLPGHVKFVKSMSDSQWETYYKALNGAARTSDPHGGRIETADFRTMIMMIHYVESLFVSFDMNRSQTLSLDELEKASVRFMSFIRELSPMKQEFFVQQGFYYIAYNGKKPTTGQFAGFQVKRLVGRVGEIDRIQLLNVFASLKIEMAK